MKRPCLVCGRLSDRAHCPDHMLTTTQRGYGRNHQLAREQLAATLPELCAGGCGTLLTIDSPWVAAHRVDRQPEYGYVASCRSCNERAKGGGATWMV